MFRLAFLQIIIFPSLGFSSTFVDLKTSGQIEELSLIKSNRVVIYVESDCEACKKYLQQLSVCSEVQRERIHVLSLSSPVQTKKAFRKYLNQFRFFVHYPSAGTKAVFVTPTTRLGDEARIGLMSCHDYMIFITHALQAKAGKPIGNPGIKFTTPNINHFRKVGFEYETN